MRYYIILSGLLFLVSCTYEAGRTKKSNQSDSRTDTSELVSKLKSSSKKKGETKNICTTESINTKLNIAIVKFLYKNYEKSPQYYFDEYEVFCSDMDLYYSALDSLYGNESDLEKIKLTLEKNAIDFIKLQQQYVIEEYQETGFLDSREYHFLVGIKDSSLIPIYQDIINRKDLDEEQMEVIYKQIDFCFPKYFTDTVL